MSHTPGPWTASNAPDGSGIPGWNITGADGTTICSLSDATPRFVRLNPINACLIAAAPALLQACEAACLALEAYTKECTYAEACNQALIVMLDAREVMAQANGENP